MGSDERGPLFVVKLLVVSNAGWLLHVLGKRRHRESSYSNPMVFSVRNKSNHDSFDDPFFVLKSPCNRAFSSPLLRVLYQLSSIPTSEGERREDSGKWGNRKRTGVSWRYFSNSDFGEFCFFLFLFCNMKVLGSFLKCCKCCK